MVKKIEHLENEQKKLERSMATRQGPGLKPFF
jgi:hypothetical protein